MFGAGSMPMAIRAPMALPFVFVARWPALYLLANVDRVHEIFADRTMRDMLRAVIEGHWSMGELCEFDSGLEPSH